ncbi:MAG: hypothetical protein WC614_06115 [bacterium]
MTKNIVLSVVFLLSVSPCIYASSNSPWGVNALWDATSPGNSNDKCKDYNKQLDSLLSGGFSWIRPANMPECESQANDFRFDRQDSIVNFAHRPAFDTLQNFISSHSGKYVNL